MKKLLLIISTVLLLNTTVYADTILPQDPDFNYSHDQSNELSYINSTYDSWDDPFNNPYNTLVEVYGDHVRCTVGSCSTRHLGGGHYEICDTGDGDCQTIYIPDNSVLEYAAHNLIVAVPGPSFTERVRDSAIESLIYIVENNPILSIPNLSDVIDEEEGEGEIP